ncbi:hypothetical protein [Streptomyces sp. NPDC048295]|uniref:hypothetical protein n=1 Tax=Streptomyces sp. NPDC048295 TaxID=3154617 RepID=UPI00343C1B94
MTPARTAKHLARHTADKDGQQRMKKALLGKIEGGTTEANLSQALNAVYDTEGKDSGFCEVDKKQRNIRHCSAGKSGGSGDGATIFYYWDKDTATPYLGIIAMGHHLDGSHYQIYENYGQYTSPFQCKKKVNVRGDQEI